MNSKPPKALRPSISLCMSPTPPALLSTSGHRKPTKPPTPSPSRPSCHPPDLPASLLACPLRPSPPCHPCPSRQPTSPHQPIPPHQPHAHPTQPAPPANRPRHSPAATQALEYGHRAIAELLANHAGKQLKEVNSVLATASRKNVQLTASRDLDQIETGTENGAPRFDA